jgi:hypothetical protein
VGAVLYTGGELIVTESVFVVPDVFTSSSFAFILNVMDVLTLVGVAANEITFVAEL